jgi:hypothetical protein
MHTYDMILQEDLQSQRCFSILRAKEIRSHGGCILSNDDAQKQSSDSQKQIYDNIFKHLIDHQAEEIIPLLFPQLQPTAIQVRTIEALPPPRRMDKVFQADTILGKVVFDIEIEASPRGRDQTSVRMLAYHGYLLDEYFNYRKERVTVRTLVIYPFDSPGGEPRFVETSGEEEDLRFSYREMSLKRLNAQALVQAGAVPLYGLLPAMKDASPELLARTLENIIECYKENEDLLCDELFCFLVLLERAKPVTGIAFEKLKRRIHMYDPILMESPTVQEWIQQSEAKGIAEGKAEGKAEAFRASIEKTLRRRFPALQELGMQRVAEISDPAALDEILDALLAAQNEGDALCYLETL